MPIYSSDIVKNLDLAQNEKLKRSRNQQRARRNLSFSSLTALLRKPILSRPRPSEPPASPAPQPGRIRSLVSSLAGSLPRTKTLSNMTNALVSSLKNQGLPECLRYLGLGAGPESGKRKRDFEDSPLAKSLGLRAVGKKPEDAAPGEFQFAKPRTYECGYCNASYYHVRVYMRHVRRHKRLLRCAGCNKGFCSIILKRRHQLACFKRAIL